MQAEQGGEGGDNRDSEWNSLGQWSTVAKRMGSDSGLQKLRSQPHSCCLVELRLDQTRRKQVKHK